jgi:hypothetical protein
MSSLFVNCKSYAGKWSVDSVSPFDAEDLAAISSAHVVNSSYGLSCCFMMKSGVMHFIPMDETCDAVAGESIDLTKAKVVTLTKPGECPIKRIRNK